MITTARTEQTTLDDQALAERAGAGDHAAFRVLFERHKGGIYRYCLLMLGEEAAAEDIYQEVFINFYRACRTGQKMYNVKGYLVTAARTRCINALRSTRRMTDFEEIDEPAYEPDFSIADLGDHLRAALMQIAPQYRDTFLLFEIEGYSYDEIAKHLGVSLGVVKNRIYRAKQGLQKILRPVLGKDIGRDED